MRERPPGLEALAEKLLLQESSFPGVGGSEVAPAARGARAGETAGPGVSVETVERVCRKLYDHLARLLGAAGVRALLNRALALARIESSFLGAVRVGEDGTLQGLREAVRKEGGPEAAAGLERIVTNLLWLLATFVGEDLTLRLLAEIWPEVSLDAAGLAMEERG